MVGGVGGRRGGGGGRGGGGRVGGPPSILGKRQRETGIHYTGGVWTPLNSRRGGAPNLRFLGSLGWGSRELDFDGTRFERSVATSLLTQLRTVKVFCLQVLRINSRRMKDFLYCFPLLERLHIKRIVNNHFATEENGPGLLPPGTEIECLNRTLQEIVLWDFAFDLRTIDFCNYLLRTARVLHSLVYVDNDVCIGAEYHILKFKDNLPNLDFVGAASPHAKLRFFYHRRSETLVEESITLETEYNDIDACRFWLGSQYYVYPEDPIAEDSDSSASEKNEKVVKFMSDYSDTDSEVSTDLSSGGNSSSDDDEAEAPDKRSARCPEGAPAMKGAAAKKQQASPVMGT